jgi:hypothetical protein
MLGSSMEGDPYVVEKLSSVPPPAAEEKSNRNDSLPVRQIHLEGLAPSPPTGALRLGPKLPF